MVDWHLRMPLQLLIFDGCLEMSRGIAFHKPFKRDSMFQRMHRVQRSTSDRCACARRSWVAFSRSSAVSSERPSRRG